jgi:hypothetical protein
MSSSGEMKISLRLMTCVLVNMAVARSSNIIMDVHSRVEDASTASVLGMYVSIKQVC